MDKKPIKMSLLLIIGLLITGLVAGYLSGLIGIGGGIIIVPALVYIFSFSQHEAQGTTLALMVPPIGILAAMEYYKKGYVDIKFSIIIIIGFLLGSYFGSKLAVTMPNAVIKKIFALIMMAIAIKMLFFDHGTT